MRYYIWGNGICEGDCELLAVTGGTRPSGLKSYSSIEEAKRVLKGNLTTRNNKISRVQSKVVPIPETDVLVANVHIDKEGYIVNKTTITHRGKVKREEPKQGSFIKSKVTALTIETSDLITSAKRNLIIVTRCKRFVTLMNSPETSIKYTDDPIYKIVKEKIENGSLIITTKNPIVGYRE